MSQELHFKFSLQQRNLGLCHSVPAAESEDMEVLHTDRSQTLQESQNPSVFSIYTLIPSFSIVAEVTAKHVKDVEA